MIKKIIFLIFNLMILKTYLNITIKKCSYIKTENFESAHKRNFQINNNSNILKILPSKRAVETSILLT